MATIGGQYLSITDLAKRMTADDKIADVIDILSQTNEVLDDMVWVEGNLPTGHLTTIRTGLPQATWRLLYQGAQPQKSTTAQITDTCGMLETYSIVDKDLADLNGNAADFRLSEDEAFLEGMNQQMAQTLFYGNIAANPERFQGLSPRYNTVQTTLAQTANNVIDAGGTGSNNTSIWLLVWGKRTIHGIYPKKTKAGLTHEDVSTPAPIDDGTGGKYQAYQTKYHALLVFAFSPRPSSAADLAFTDRYDDLIRAAVHRYWGGAPDWHWWKAQLYQESMLDPAAVSPVGAAGLAQFMPATWADVSHQLGWSGISPHVAKYAIDGGAYYMARLRQVWHVDRPLLERHRLAQASYNAGTGNILAAQARCRGANSWDEIKPCLGGVTGPQNARQTIDYVDRIATWYRSMR